LITTQVQAMKRRNLVLLPVAMTAAACGKPPDAATPAPAAATQSNAAAPTEALALAAQGHGFTVGVAMAANPVYVFFDATCPHCAQLWVSAKPLLNRIKMVWLPVGIHPQASFTLNTRSVSWSVLRARHRPVQSIAVSALSVSFKRFFQYLRMRRLLHFHLAVWYSSLVW
jgi:hypothetical protein